MASSGVHITKSSSQISRISSNRLLKGQSSRFRVCRTLYLVFMILVLVANSSLLKLIASGINRMSFSIFRLHNGKSSEDYSSLLESAQSLTSTISPQLLELFNSLKHPHDEGINREKLIAYYTSALLQIKAQSMEPYHDKSHGDILVDHKSNTNGNKNDWTDGNTDTKNSLYHACKSRHEQFFHHRKPIPSPSPHFFAVLNRYAEFHGNCVSKIQSWKNEIDQSINATGCRYLYVTLPQTPSDLGAKLVALVSSVVYAILTHRVLVLPKHEYAHLLCEPFPDSSWILPFTIPRSRIKDIAQIEELLIHDQPWLTYATCRPGHAFNCRNSQKKIYKLPWLMMQSDMYFIPELYIIPSFRKLLDEIFPDRNVFTHLARYFLLPSDDLWRSILHLKRAYMGNADRHIGMHIRSFSSDAWMNSNLKKSQRIRIINQHLGMCSIRISKVLPKPTNDTLFKLRLNSPMNSNLINTDGIKTDETSKFISIFIVSEFADRHSQYLKGIYLNGGLNGEVLSVQYSRATHKSDSSSEEEQKSFSEVWLLSFMDDLFTSASSTFSFVAQGLGGHQPWVFHFDSRNYCFQRPRSEPCELRVRICPSNKYLRRNPKNMTYLYLCKDSPQSYGLSANMKN